MNSIRRLVQEIRQRFGNFPFFFVVGGTCTAIDLALLYCLTDVLGLWYVYSGVISFIIVSAISFILHKTISFVDRQDKFHKQYVKFLFVVSVGMVINNSTLFVLTHFVGLWYIISRLVASFIAMIWNYTANSKLVFNLNE